MHVACQKPQQKVGETKSICTGAKHRPVIWGHSIPEQQVIIITPSRHVQKASKKGIKSPQKSINIQSEESKLFFYARPGRIRRRGEEERPSAAPDPNLSLVKDNTKRPRAATAAAFRAKINTSRVCRDKKLLFFRPHSAAKSPWAALAARLITTSLLGVCVS